MKHAGSHSTSTQPLATSSLANGFSHLKGGPSAAKVKQEESQSIDGPSDPGSVSGSLRHDTVAIKRELVEALGENGPIYWKKFKDYLMGRASMREFDEVAAKVLGQDCGKFLLVGNA
jgi:hypothetical protein